MKKWTWQWLALLGLAGMIFLGVEFVRAELIPPTPLVDEDSAMNVKLYWENVIEYFEEEDWPLYEVDDDARTAVSYIRGDNATFRI